MFLHRFMVRPWSYNVLLCARVCVCVSHSCPTSRLITEFFGFSLQQAARFQPALACHLSPHSPLWPRTQPPIWGDSSSLSLSLALFFSHTCTISCLCTCAYTISYLCICSDYCFCLYSIFFFIILKTHFCWRCIFKSIFCEFSKSLFSLLANYC